MRDSIWIPAAMMMMVAAPAAAQTVTLAPDEGASVTNPGSAPVATRMKASLTPFEAAVVKQFEANLFPDAMGANSATVSGDGLPEPEPIAPDRFVAKFMAIGGGKATLLVLENGYDQAIAYRARITVKGKTTPTDVCIVLPGKRGFENWPYAIEKIELSAIALEKYDGGRPRCE